MKRFDDFILCGLRQPKDDTEKILYALYITTGHRAEDKKHVAKSYNAYHLCFSNGSYGPQYNCTDDSDFVPWLVPEWTFTLAVKIQKLKANAQSIGTEKGYTRGLRKGKAFAVALAKGELTTKDFDTADGRDDRRLNRKKW